MGGFEIANHWRISMNTLPNTLKHSFWIVLLILLAACGSGHTPPTPSAIHQTSATPVPPTTAPTETLTPTPPTDTPFPTATPSPAMTPEPTEPVVTIPGLRLAYIVDGNLYVQDSGGKPLQLTHTGLDSGPVLSDDGQKLVFLRAKHSDDKKKGIPRDLYSINADGSGERFWINAGQMMALSPKYDQFSEVYSWEFVPGTHSLLFTTIETSPNCVNGFCDEAAINRDLYWVDLDSGQLRPIADPKQVKRFASSPNGQQLAVQRIKDGWPSGQIDIIGLNGKIIHEDIFGSMFPDTSSQYGQDYVAIRWAADGSRLIAVPGDELDLPGTGRVIWQYSMANGSVVETHFDPPPVSRMFAISPDGNWVAYTYYDTVSDDEARFGMYLGNFHNGKTRLIDKERLYGFPDDYAHPWSPDSQYFVFATPLDYTQDHIGDLQGQIFSPGCRKILAWVDAKHYLCGRILMGEFGKKNLDWVVQIPNDFPYIDEFTFVFRKDQIQTGK
jgi:hypothetical protein